MFKLQHPADLISRMFILEYMREIGAKDLYAKATPEQRKNIFYKFSTEEGFEDVDVNWEACLFDLTLSQIELLLKDFMPEIEVIEAKRSAAYKQRREEMIKEDIDTPVDVNIMDIAKAAMKKQEGKITGMNGLHLN